MSKYKGTRQQNPQSVSITNEIMEKKGHDPIVALAALYQGEKTDASYVFNTAMAMMGIAVAYLIGAIPFVEKFGTGSIGWLFVLLLPIPLWLIVAFHSLITLNAMSHGISVKIIEDVLFRASELQVNRDLVGSAAGDRIMDITKAKFAHQLTTVVVYGGVALLVIGFTAYSLYSAKAILEHDGAWFRDRALWTAIATYSLLLIIVALSWIVGLRMIGEGRSEIPEDVKS